MRTATTFSLALFPQIFLFQRILHSDVIFVLTDRSLDERNHINRCVVRTASDTYRNLSIPLERHLLLDNAADATRVPSSERWLPGMLSEVRRWYRGLRHGDLAQNLLQASFGASDSPWLIDYLMSGFLHSMLLLGWQDKEVVRGASVERRCFLSDSSYLLQLCLEYNCDQLIVGRSQRNLINRKLFHRNEIDLKVQVWDGSRELPSRDSILDALARYTPDEIVTRLIDTELA